MLNPLEPAENDNPLDAAKPNGAGDPISVKQPNPDGSKGPLLSPLVVNGIAMVVTFMWAGSFIADILSTEYQPPTGIHLAFMVVLGSIFGSQLFQRK